MCKVKLCKTEERMVNIVLIPTPDKDTARKKKTTADQYPLMKIDAKILSAILVNRIQ